MTTYTLPFHLNRFLSDIEHQRPETLKRSLDDYNTKAPLLRAELAYVLRSPTFTEGERDFIKAAIQKGLTRLRKKVRKPEAIAQISHLLGYKEVRMEYVELEPPTIEDHPYLELSPSMGVHDILEWLNTNKIGAAFNLESCALLKQLIEDTALIFKQSLAQELAEYIDSPYKDKPVFITLKVGELAVFLRALWESDVINPRTKQRQFIRAFASILQQDSQPQTISPNTLEDKTFHHLEHGVTDAALKNGRPGYIQVALKVLEYMTTYLTKAKTKPGLFSARKITKH